jgi:ribose 5-phosphate isomerase B
MSKKYFIASDHAGFNIKEVVKKKLQDKGFEVIDLGCHNEDRVDYPDYGHKLALEILKNKGTLGVLVCGSGIGISISANRHYGVRAALCHDEYGAKMARAHNDANVLCLGARVTNEGNVGEILDAWCDGEFEGGRHTNRVKKLDTPPN